MIKVVPLPKKVGGVVDHYHDVTRGNGFSLSVAFLTVIFSWGRNGAVRLGLEKAVNLQHFTLCMMSKPKNAKMK